MKLVLVSISLFLFIGCKLSPPPPNVPLVETIAILPFDNESNDVNAPDVLQELVYQALKESSYKPLDIKDVNQKLESVGIVDGGQLAIVDPTKLGKDLAVQALMFGYVENFDYTNIGFYRQRKVTLSLKLVDVLTGATLWESTGTGLQPEVAVKKEDATKAFLEGVAEQTVEKILKSPLQAEAETAVINSLKRLPGFSFHGFAGQKKDLLKGVIRKSN